jgi:hypothetical protein
MPEEDKEKIEQQEAEQEHGNKPLVMEYVPHHTGALFHADNESIVKAIMGPVGSGKSITCIMECLFKAIRQKPNAKGVRRTRCAIIRNTYGELKTTTIKSFTDWIPPENCRISTEAPYTGVVHGDLPDGTSFEAEFIFLALDKPDDAHRLLSLELTFAWINEAREIPETIFRQVLQRTGRFPRKIEAETTWSGVIMDTNPPDTDHWYYDLAEVHKDPRYKFYRQPGGIIKVGDQYLPNPLAENIDHLSEGYDYYLKQCTSGADPNMIRVMLMGEYGSLRSDRPVYPQFSDTIHVVDDLPVNRNAPLLLMFDFGLTPACLIGQKAEFGRLHILQELYDDNNGLKQFLDEMVCPMLATERFRGLPVSAVCDPAGIQRSQADATLTPVSEISRHGISVFPAKTNEFAQRKAAVEQLLTRLTPGGKPALLIDKKHCRRLIKGFISGYSFRRKVGYNDLYKDVPEKNKYSHVHDALQYGALEVSIDTIRRDEQKFYQHSAMAYGGGGSGLGVADPTWDMFA